METFILLCPVCCSTVDAELPEEGEDAEQTFDCSVCSQEWTMVIDPVRMATHSRG